MLLYKLERSIRITFFYLVFSFVGYVVCLYGGRVVGRFGLGVCRFLGFVFEIDVGMIVF